jgi:hypothetical protein
MRNKIKLIMFGVLVTLSNGAFAYTYVDNSARNPASRVAGCSNPITLKETKIYSRKWGGELGKIQLRYSSSCKGVWTKFIGYKEQEIELSVTAEGEYNRTWNGSPNYGVFRDHGRISWTSFLTVKEGELVEGSAYIHLYRNGIASADFGPVRIPKESSESFSLVRNGFGINAYSPKNYRKVIMWEYSKADKDQKWVKSGSLIKRLSSNYCLNTPYRSNGGNVFLWRCNKNDSDQQWKFSWKNDNTTNIALGSTGYCLRSNNPKNYSNLRIWRCDPNNSNQRFVIKK